MVLSDVTRCTTFVQTCLAAKQVCLGPVRSATYTNCFGESGNTLRSATTFCNLQPDLLQDKFDSCVVQRATSPLNSFCSNVTKQVARCCRPFYRNFSYSGFPIFQNSLEKSFFVYGHCWLRELNEYLLKWLLWRSINRRLEKQKFSLHSHVFTLLFLSVHILY